MAASQSPATLLQARAVLEFWLEDGLELGWPSRSLSSLWYGGGSALDQQIEACFGHLVRAAVEGGLAEWETHPLDRLALVILLDQFTRNVFRGQAVAFAGDARAQALVMDALGQRWIDQLPLVGRVFLHMPLMHAESITLQDESVRAFSAMLAGAPADRLHDLQGQVDYAKQHRDIVVSYGRFPYRNAVLGRASSAPEQEFLQTGRRFGQ